MNKLFLTITAILFCAALNAKSIKGVVVDKSNGEPLIGAVVIVQGTSVAVVTGVEGEYQIDKVKDGVTLEFTYLSYKTVTVEAIELQGSETTLDVEMEPDQVEIDEIVVVGRKVLESVGALSEERKISSVAIENLGAQEMSLKGISNVEEGVTKMTGISVASAGQIVVRGLGDRYSSTTLNGQPIASPNPDNKLVPLDIFPSSAVRNVTVTKVYNAEKYADYSGAHIDIATKDQRTSKFFSVGFSLGGYLNTIGKDFYRMDGTSLFSKPTVDPYALSASKASTVAEYAANNNIFSTDYSVGSKTTLPSFSGNIGYGDTFNVGNQKLSVLATGGINNSQEIALNNEFSVMEASGTLTDIYSYDSYTSKLNMAALANIGLSLRDNDHISYTAFYARNAEEEFQIREGDTDNQGHIFTINSVNHIYTLLTQQINGSHQFGKKWDLGWNGSYTTTSSEEPDRRQVIFKERSDYAETGNLMLFTGDSQSTFRYFGNLDENEWNADIHSSFKFGEDNKLTFGGAYKNKTRDYTATRFYFETAGLFSLRYDVDGGNMFNTDNYINQDNIANGTLVIDRDQGLGDQYNASMDVKSAYTSLDLTVAEKLLLNIGLRYEDATQTVNYYSNGYGTRVLRSKDLFPALNLRYSLLEGQQVRLAASRTVTRPSFVEMSPFQYQESYGSYLINGNENLENGYNYNVDFRYESFFDKTDMFSFTFYYKKLVDPIERVQSSSGGATVQTYMNANDGVAAGAEVEFRKTFNDVFTLNLNGSYMYTNVSLTDEGVYTNSERQLQGASPYLFNADISYTPTLNNNRKLSLALLYNLQGPRIYAVGINNNTDVMQETYQKLNFVASYALSDKVTLKAELNNILCEDQVYTQQIGSTGEKLVVGRYNQTIAASIGASLNF